MQTPKGFNFLSRDCSMPVQMSFMSFFVIFWGGGTVIVNSFLKLFVRLFISKAAEWAVIVVYKS